MDQLQELDTVQESKTFGSLIAYNYKANNPMIKQVEKVANYLELRKARKAKKEKALQLMVKGNEAEAWKVFNSQPRTKKARLGELQNKSDAWYFTSFNGVKFRIPETENGIEDFFDCEFKKVSE